MRERESAQLSFADTVVSRLGGKRTQALLNQLDAAIDWESLAKPLRAVYRNADGGAPAGSAVMMLKTVMLQKWFNLSDPQAEEQLNDRMSFRRFVGLRGEEPAPDETTIVVFRQRLREANLDRTLFDLVNRSIGRRGLLLNEGTLVDALILEAPPSSSHTANRLRRLFRGSSSGCGRHYLHRSLYSPLPRGSKWTQNSAIAHCKIKVGTPNLL